MAKPGDDRRKGKKKGYHQFDEAEVHDGVPPILRLFGHHFPPSS